MNSAVYPPDEVGKHTSYNELNTGGISMDYAKESLRMHYRWKGKIEVVAAVPTDTKDALSLAYTPGVAQPCLEIQKDINKS